MFLIAITKKEIQRKITYAIPQELKIRIKNSSILLELGLKYSHMLFTVMMLINNKLKPFPKTNPLRTDS